MVRMLVREPQNDDIHYVELAGLSTDEKPTGFATGSLFMEVDTGDVFLYNEDSSQWVKVGGA
jgi:hypothetical protein